MGGDWTIGLNIEKKNKFLFLHYLIIIKFPVKRHPLFEHVWGKEFANENSVPNMVLANFYLSIKLKPIIMANKEDRDIEKSYPKSEFVAKLRRLADVIENGERFEIQIAGERIYVPKRAVFNIEHEREDNEEEIEFQIKWSHED
jgi:amphi-Trp domain-containing protein